MRLVVPAVDRGVNGTQKACVGGTAARRVVKWYLVTVGWVNIAIWYDVYLPSTDVLAVGVCRGHYNGRTSDIWQSNCAQCLIKLMYDWI